MICAIIQTDTGWLHLSHSSTTIKPQPGKSDSLLHADQRITKQQAFLFTGEVLNCVKAQLFNRSTGGLRVNGIKWQEKLHLPSQHTGGLPPVLISNIQVCSSGGCCFGLYVSRNQ